MEQKSCKTHMESCIFREMENSESALIWISHIGLSNGSPAFGLVPSEECSSQAGLHPCSGGFPSDDSVSLTHGPFHVESAAAFSSDLRCLQGIL